MKWIENLAELANDCEHHEYKCDIPENLAQAKLDYYIDQYSYYRSELDSNEAKQIVKQIILIGETLCETYPSIQPTLDDFKSGKLK